MLERRTETPMAGSDRTRSELSGQPQLLSMSVVGPFSASCGGDDVRLRTRKAGALLAYLAMSETKQESRERLVGFLWSRSDEMKARTSLRQVVHDLRQAFSTVGFDGFHAGKLNVTLKAESIEVDLLQVLHQADQFRAHSLLLHTPRLTERLFEGLDDLDPSFRVWVLAKRQTIQDRLLRSLNAGLASSAVEGAIKHDLAAAIINIDPTHEEACRYAMEARAVAGDAAGALRLYKALWDLLDHEYGMEPSPETQDLVASIKLGKFERPSGRSGPSALATERPFSRSVADKAPLPISVVRQPTMRAPRIALLLAPFEMNGVEPDKAHLVSGFRHHLAACLVRFREWSVIDNGSASISLPAGASMPAQYALDATAYQAGPTVNMVLTLRENAQGLYVWSESFELTLANWFEAQQRVIRRLTSSLSVQLSTERLVRLSAVSDVSLETYDRWLRGQYLLTRFDAESWRRAVELFEAGIQAEPTFSPYYSSLVQMNNTEHFVHPGKLPDQSKATRTLALAKTATELDPVDSRAHLSLGWSHAFAVEFDDAALHMDLARELNNNDPGTLISTAGFWAFCGQSNKAVEIAREAMMPSFAPAPYYWSYYAIVLFLSGNYRDALEAADHSDDAIQTMPAWRAATLFYLGRRNAAEMEGRRFLNNIRSCWFGHDRPSDQAIAHWLLHAHPIRSKEQWECLRDGLSGASIPTAGIKHSLW